VSIGPSRSARPDRPVPSSRRPARCGHPLPLLHARPVGGSCWSGSGWSGLDNESEECYQSYRCSIEHKFDHRQEVTVAAIVDIGSRLLPPPVEGSPAGRKGAYPRPYLVGPTVAPVEPSDRTAGALRLTRRGRLVVTGLLLVVGVGLSMVMGGVGRADTATHPSQVRYVTVSRGDTLWGIAAEVSPGSDRRDTVQRILDLNALGTVAVIPGQRIAVPVG
jgi:hypothetical protein